MVQCSLIQKAMSDDIGKNVKEALNLVEEAAKDGGQIILLPELFSSRYFPQSQLESSFDIAIESDDKEFISPFQEMAQRLGVVLPISYFERSGQSYFNSLVMIDADGRLLGHYRKSHIPDGPGYQEKYYFTPGDTGFRVWNTRYGRIGVGVCWDQWFPEAARIMTLQGADILLYPTAIGSEPPEAGDIDTRQMWRRAMIGHAVCNAIYVGAANRVGKERACEFYGHSFIADYQGDLMDALNVDHEGIVSAQLDFAAARRFRASMGFFRDRRPDLYSSLLSHDGK